jgi:hypothetical protein
MNKKMQKIINNMPEIYQADSGAIALHGDLIGNTIWASQEQIAGLFGVDRSVITKHITNIFSSLELEKGSVSAIFAHTAADGKDYKVYFYKLDLILSVGYRVNSYKATKFRQWSSKILSDYLIEGVVINRSLVEENYKIFEKAMQELKNIAKDKSIDPSEITEIISSFAYTWLSLDGYDRETISNENITKQKVKLTAESLLGGIAELKADLIAKNEATELFATDKTKDSIESIVANIMQSFGDEELYPTLEEKAACLLYFTVKNHPFIDGNKRSGAFAFIWFLSKYSKLDRSRISPQALAAITLLVAISDPKDKDRLVQLIMSMIGSNS